MGNVGLRNGKETLESAQESRTARVIIAKGRGGSQSSRMERYRELSVAPWLTRHAEWLVDGLCRTQLCSNEHSRNSQGGISVMRYALKQDTLDNQASRVASACPHAP